MSALRPLAGAASAAGCAGDGVTVGGLPPATPPPTPLAAWLPLPPAGEGWGEGAAFADAAGASPPSRSAAGADAEPAPSPSSTAITAPSRTVSPTLTFSSTSLPAAVDGTSIVA